MTLLKGALHRSGTFMDEISQQEETAKKKPADWAGFKLFSWRRIVETGALCCAAICLSNDEFPYPLLAGVIMVGSASPQSLTGTV
jgi:hypothetical protein